MTLQELNSIPNRISDIKKLDRIIKDKHEEVQSLKGISYGVKVQTSRVDQTKRIDELIDLQRHKEKMIIDLMLLIHETYCIIQTMSYSLARAVADMRYISGMTWQQIAEETEKTPRHLRRINQNTLLEWEEKGYIEKGA